MKMLNANSKNRQILLNYSEGGEALLDVHKREYD